MWLASSGLSTARKALLICDAFFVENNDSREKVISDDVTRR